MSRIFAFLLLSALAASCSKQEVPRYEEPDTVTFYYNYGGADSASYSFSTIGYGKSTDTVFLQMRVVGAVINSDRKVQLRTVEGSTAREGVDYKLPEFTLAAGESYFLYPLVVYKTPEMKEQTLRLILEVVPNEDFPGVAGEGLVAGLTTALNTYNHNRIKVDITDKLIRPGNWPSKFGTYSDRKYQFIIETLGTGDFRLTSQGGVWTSLDFDYARVALREALIQWELINGIMLDENQERVIF